MHAGIKRGGWQQSGDVMRTFSAGRMRAGFSVVRVSAQRQAKSRLPGFAGRAEILRKPLHFYRKPICLFGYARKTAADLFVTFFGGAARQRSRPRRRRRFTAGFAVRLLQIFAMYEGGSAGPGGKRGSAKRIVKSSRKKCRQTARCVCRRSLRAVIANLRERVSLAVPA